MLGVSPAPEETAPVVGVDGVEGVDGRAGVLTLGAFDPWDLAPWDLAPWDFESWDPPCAGLLLGGFARGVVGRTGAATSGSGAGRSWISGTRVRLGAFRSTTAVVVTTPRTRKATIANLTRVV